MFHSGLRKIFAINSYIKKALLSEFDVDSPTQLTGENGIGKTTLLRLIPIFYGAEGRLVSRKTNVNQSFTEFYLPRADSFIVFEFASARGEIAHVILYRHPTNGQLCYRFVKGCFDSGILIKPDTNGKARAIPSSQLVEALQANGRTFEKVVSSVKKYRSIIQHVNPASFESNYLSYSLCTGRNDIRHIEKITASLIQGSFSMHDTKSLFMEILDREDGDLKFGLEASQVDRWCNDYKGLNEFLTKKELFAKAVHNNRLIKSTALDLCQILTVLNNEEHVKSEGLEEVEQKLIDIATATKESLDDISSQLLTQNSKSAKVKENIRIISAEIEVDEEQLFEYEEGGYAELSVQLDFLPNKIIQLADNITRHADLQKEVQNVEQQFDLDVKIANEKHTKQVQGINTEISNVRLAEQKSLNAIGESLRTKRNAQNNSFSKSVEELRKMKSEDETALAVLKQKVNTANAPEQMLEERCQLDKSISRQKDTISSKRNDLSAKQLEKQEKSSNREWALVDMRNTNGQLEDAMRQLEAVQKRLDPSSGSLYSFLEANVPNWQEKALGKILSESVLMNDSLCPEVDLAGGDNLYGLYVDTSELPVNTVTNERDQSQLDELIELVDDLEAKKKDLESSIDVFNADVEKLDRDIELLKSEIEADLESLDQLTDSLEDKIVAISREKANAKDSLKKELKSAEARVRDLGDQITAMKESNDDIIQGLESTALEQRLSTETTTEGKIEALEAELEQAEERFKHTLDTLKLEMEQRLNQQGISREVYQKYEDLIKTLEGDIEALKLREHEIRQYRSWLSAYHKTQPSRQKDLAAQEKELGEIEAIISGLVRDKKKIEAEKKSQETALNGRKNTLKSEVEKITSIKLRISGHDELVAKELGEGFEYNGDLLTLVNKADNMVTSYSDKKRVRKKDVRELEEVTRNWGEGELLELWRDTSSQRTENTDSQHIDVLEEIIENIIPQITSMTIASATNMGSMLVNFKDALLDFDREIKGLGRKISEQVRQNNHFSVVESIDINVASSLSRISGWGEINDFAVVYADWERNGDRGLPPEEFFSALKLIATHITEEKLEKPAELFDIKFEVVENGKRKIATNDKDMKELASNGTNLLIQSMLYVAMLSNQRGASHLSITFPTDEIGKLTAENQAGLMGLLDANNFKIVAALPDPKGQTMGLFKNLYHVTQNGILTNKPQPSKLQLAKEKKRLEKESQAKKMVEGDV